MAIQDDPYKSALIALYNKAAASPMSIEEYAAEFAKITDTQILTGEVADGIPVSTSGGGGATTGKGKVI
jgi:hypothetical protein